jgi:hypothetical protein
MNTDKHYLDKQRLQGDKEADLLVNAIFSSNRQAELYKVFRLNANQIKLLEQSDLKQFLISVKVKPAWYDDDRLLHGQQVFKQYAQEMMTLLGAMSLPYCYAASPGNKALYLSEKMRQATGKRLIETAGFVINVLTPSSLSDDQEGHLHINKTRLIHALSRYHLQQSNWNMEWGLPINQEDMAGTNLAFSYIILLGMQQAGFSISHKEKEDFLFVWRYIGYQLNIEEELLPESFAEATLFTQIIKDRNFKKTEEGISLTTELLNYFKMVIPAEQATFISAQIRFCLGKEVADYIGLQPEPFKDRITSVVNSLKAIQNMLSAPTNSYDKMMADHVRLRKKFIG